MSSLPTPTPATAPSPRWRWPARLDTLRIKLFLSIAGANAVFPSTAAANDRLAFTRRLHDEEIYRFEPGRSAQPFARSSLFEGLPQFSPDGRRISFTSLRSGDAMQVWVANAEEAQVVIIFAATRPGLRGQGVTAFLVPMTTPGITRTARADSLGVRGLGCMDLELDIAVGEDQVLGPVDHGFPLAMWALQGGRIAIAAQALGIGEAALDEALAYAKTREQFGQPNRRDLGVPGHTVRVARLGIGNQVITRWWSGAASCIVSRQEATT